MSNKYDHRNESPKITLTTPTGEANGKEAAEVFNNFFANIGTKLASKMRPPNPKQQPSHQAHPCTTKGQLHTKKLKK